MAGRRSNRGRWGARKSISIASIHLVRLVGGAAVVGAAVISIGTAGPAAAAALRARRGAAASGRRQLDLQMMSVTNVRPPLEWRLARVRATSGAARRRVRTPGWMREAAVWFGLDMAQSLGQMSWRAGRSSRAAVDRTD